MLRVLLVDEQTLIRESLAAQLSACPSIAGIDQAADGDAAVLLAAERRPGLVIMDTDLPGKDAFTAVARIRELDPNCRFLFLGSDAPDTYLQEALRNDANGYVLKQDGLDMLLQAVEKIAEGGRYFSETILCRLRTREGRWRLHRPRNVALATLTRRERELLVHLGTGASLKEAAAVMRISYKTADNQKASLMRKLDIHDRVELARYAIREGLVSAI